MTIVEAIIVPLSVLFTVHSSQTEVQIVVPILAGALALAITVLGVFSVHLIAAPIQQRNELRAALPVSTALADEAPNPEIRILNFARVGNEKATEMEQRERPTASQRAGAEQWTNEVVAFLEAHLPLRGREFLDAGNNWGADSVHLHRRIAAKAQALRAIAEDLP